MAKQTTRSILVSASQVIALGFCSCGGSPTLEASANRPPARTMALTIPMGTGREVEFVTLPHSACTLRPLNSSSGASSLELYSDLNGALRFRFEQPSTGQVPDTDLYSLDCLSQTGQSRQNLFVINSDPSASEYGTPATGGSGPSGTLRPALTGEQLTALPQSELLARGYPLRPDAASDPAAFADWMTQVSTPVLRVTEDLTVIPTRHGSAVGRTLADTANSDRWSGFVITTPGSIPYETAGGNWHVPTVVANNPQIAETRYSLVWAGLDGVGTRDLIQAGTGEDISINPGHASTTSYYAWIEYLPNPLVKINNLPIHPGDTISMGVRVGDSAGNVNPNGGFGWYEIVNNTTLQSFDGKLGIPGGTTFFGNTAEWIVERPTINGSLPHLADYQTASIYGILSLSWNGSTPIPHNLATNPGTNMSMHNGLTLLSSATEVSSSQANYTFSASF